MAPAGIVEAIFIAPEGSAPMRSVLEVQAVPGGLDGDRYLAQTGYWTSVDECQVTMIEGEGLDSIEESSGVAVGEGQHRRNIVTRGVELRGLAGKQFRVGESVLEYDRPRPPCRYIESITQPGMTRSLAARRGGICVRVLKAGLIRVGDTIEVVGDASAPPVSGLRRILRG